MPTAAVALKPRQNVRRDGLTYSSTSTDTDVVDSTHDAFGLLLVTEYGKVHRRQGYTGEWEEIAVDVPKVHGIDREASGAIHIVGGAGEHLVSTDGGSTWLSLT